MLINWAYLLERARRHGFDSVRDWFALAGSYNAIDRFRRDFGKYAERRYILPLNSGTSANEAVIFGLGLEPGAEVVCPAASPIFVSMSILAAGAIPVFADVNPQTLIPGADDIKRCLSSRTRAIVVVHQFGQPAPMDEILALAKDRRLKIVEDCAQAYASYYGNCKVGTLGDVMCSSLQRSKHLTSIEGGFVATDDPEIYKRSVLYSNAGMPAFGYDMATPEPDVIDGFRVRGHWSFGHIHRMTNYQATVACLRLKRLDSFCRMRRFNVAALEDRLQNCQSIELAPHHEGSTANFWQYPLQLNSTHIKASALEIVKKVFDRIPRAPITAHAEINYLERVFQDIERTRIGPHGQVIPDSVSYAPGTCPVAEEAAKRSFHVNVHHTIPAFFLKYVANTIKEVFEENE